MTIEVFSASWCQGCKTVKKVLNEKGIAYSVTDIESKEGMEKAKALGIRNIPVTLVGDSLFVGSSDKVIKEILEAAV